MNKSLTGAFREEFTKEVTFEPALEEFMSLSFRGGYV